MSYQPIRGSIVVSIPACHVGDRGSIPCHGVFFSLQTFLVKQYRTLTNPNTQIQL